MIMNKFNTTELDRILQEQDWKRETHRLALIAKTLRWLDDNTLEYGIERAYLFGSITRPHQFYPRSDVDLAVESIDSNLHFLAISLLSEHLEREVDIIKLGNCHFGSQIREKGILWTPKN
ncbi:MAG: hypothetical protein N5P05_001165 [Chroococcopsis gigantea SAG 12.99]|jgi:predicted nucleotidyltransferase|nr:hypothetical protein [Chroococcopsis gigantea SAG 12.99]